MLAQIIDAPLNAIGLSPIEWRREHRMSQAQAAKFVGLYGRNPARTWSRWERGEAVPPMAVVARIEQESGGRVTAASWVQAGLARSRPSNQHAQLQAGAPSATHAVVEPDASLIALAAELEATATPHLAYDRDLDVTSTDPDYHEVIETGRRLWLAVEAVTEKIFVHQPETLAGLLVVAHAATIAAEERWDEKPEFVGPDGRLLRLVCNGLFRLAGVDWRGRPVSRTRLPIDTAATASLDAALIPLAEAAIAEQQAANAVAAQAEYGAPVDTFARSIQLLELVTSVEARTTTGLAAKARVLLTHIPEGQEFEGDWRCEALSLSIARDVARLAEAA